MTIDASRTGREIPSDFIGLSFEAPVLTAPALSSPRSHLPELLRSLGIGLLRFGGISVDHSQWMPTPGERAPWAIAVISPSDLGGLARLASATGWRVLLGLNLGHPDAVSLADEARVAAGTLGSSLAGVAIGNEPDRYTRPLPRTFRSVARGRLRPGGWGPGDYAVELTRLVDAIAAAGVSVPLFGPDTSSSGSLARYVTPHLGVVTEHIYANTRCDSSGRTRSRRPSIASLLSRRAERSAMRNVDQGLRVGAGLRLPVRIDETNSVACGGQRNTSDTFASALWALNYGLLVASNGVAGINFHGGLGSCRYGGTVRSPWYSPLCQLPGGELVARPEYYALLVLHLLEGSSFVPVAYRTSHRTRVYALLAPDGALRVVVDDMDTHTGPGRGSRRRRVLPVEVRLNVSPAYQLASVVRLTAPSINATRGVTFGGASVRPDGTFTAAVSEPVRGGAGQPQLTVEPGSAAVVTLVRAQTNAARGLVPRTTPDRYLSAR